jgi:cystathionine beta-synthase
MKSKFNNVLEMVGNTPVLKINNIDTGKCDLYVKMESLNPFGSIKDRVGLKMIQDAENQGLIKEGYTIIESNRSNCSIN